LPRLLNALFAQRTARRFEVLVVDTGSTDSTLSNLEGYPVRVVEIGQPDVGRLRNLMFDLAAGDIVVHLGQDAVPASSDWLDNLIGPLGEEGIGASCGPALADPDRVDPPFFWESVEAWFFTCEARRFQEAFGRPVSFANMAVPRSVWQRLQVDTQAALEDLQFQKKLRAAGLGVAFPEAGAVYHQHSYTPEELFRRCRNEGLAMKQMGFPYSEFDLLRDLLSPRMRYAAWRARRAGRLVTPAEQRFLRIRPWAVYCGSRFTRRPRVVDQAGRCQCPVLP
jgi:glycosyltransferase involved in cell wall biosynthesis